MASFDRRLCKGLLTGSIAAAGKACSEGWKLYTIPGPQFKGVAMKGGSAEAPYYDWVDQHDTLGLGNNVPIATGNLSDAMFALVDGKWVTIRVGPIRWGFSPRAWTAASTIRKPADGAGAFTPPIPGARAPTSREARASRRKSFTSNSAPIPWRGEA